MTSACKNLGKRVDNFWATVDAKPYLEALGQLPEFTGVSLIETKMGRNGGTWAHPKLAVFFARWLDVKFAVFCDMVIDDILNKKAELTITKPAESAVMTMPTNMIEAGERWLAALKEAEAHKQQVVVLEEKVEALEHELTHMTVMEYQAHIKRYLSQGQKTRLGKTATEYCRIYRIAIAKKEMNVTDIYGNPRLSLVGVYPVAALEYAATIVGI